MNTTEVRPDWGHIVLSPEGAEVRLPQFAFPKLRRMGLLERDQTTGLQQISERVYLFIGAEYDSLMDGLRQLLGVDMSGPEWLQCGCRRCHRFHEQADKTPMSKVMRHINRQ